MMTQTPRAAGNPAWWTVGMIVVATAAFWALLGWDTEKDLDPVTQAESGPYSAWQVLALAAIVALLAFAAGAAGRALLATVVIAATMAVNVAVGALRDADGDGLWPIGAALTLVGTAVGVALVAALGGLVRRRR